MVYATKEARNAAARERYQRQKDDPAWVMKHHEKYKKWYNKRGKTQRQSARALLPPRRRRVRIIFPSYREVYIPITPWNADALQEMELAMLEGRDPKKAAHEYNSREYRWLNSIRPYPLYFGELAI